MADTARTGRSSWGSGTACRSGSALWGGRDGGREVISADEGGLHEQRCLESDLGRLNNEVGSSDSY